jgi:RNA polymerase sigma-70 factor, ECF subfamily
MRLAMVDGTRFWRWCHHATAPSCARPTFCWSYAGFAYLPLHVVGAALETFVAALVALAVGTNPAEIAEGEADAPLAAEDEAMARYSGGEDKAMGELYDRLAPRLYQFLLRRLRHQAEAEDVLQQTFLQIHRARGTFVSGSRVAPWAFVICRRLLVDRVRSRGSRESKASQELDEKMVDPRGDIESMVYARELGEQAAKVLDALPAAQRHAFVMLRIDQLSVVEAADVLGVSVSAVKLRAHRAYVALEEQLGASAT